VTNRHAGKRCQGQGDLLDARIRRRDFDRIKVTEAVLLSLVRLGKYPLVLRLAHIGTQVHVVHPQPVSEDGDGALPWN
jgi:hypothetical protein